MYFPFFWLRKFVIFSYICISNGRQRKCVKKSWSVREKESDEERWECAPEGKIKLLLQLQAVLRRSPIHRKASKNGLKLKWNASIFTREVKIRQRRIRIEIEREKIRKVVEYDCEYIKFFCGLATAFLWLEFHSFKNSIHIEAPDETLSRFTIPFCVCHSAFNLSK